MFENRIFRTNKALGGIIFILSRQNKRHVRFYKKGKGRRQFYDEQGNLERQLILDRLLV